MILTPSKIIARLTKLNILSAEVLKEAQKFSNIKQLEKFLIENGLNSEEITKIKADILKVPYIDLRFTNIPQEIFDVFPQDIIKKYQIVAFLKEGNELSVGMVDPQNFQAVQSAEFLIKKNRFKVKYYIISVDSFRAVLKRNSTLDEEVEEALDIATDKYVQAQEETKNREKLNVETVKGAPISKIVSVIIRHAVEGRASDIHIEPGHNSSKVRYRVDGVLHTSLALPLHVHASIISRIKIMANLKIDETRIPQDGRISINIDNRQIDFRVSIFPLMNSEKVVLRVLDTLSGVMNLSELGFNKRHEDLIKEAIKASNGLFLLTGPTGSGKTTTLYSVLDILNKDNVNILTLEDPVEYFIEGVNQSQVRPEIGYTFASGLRSILRQDPDIVMVGEVRDSETAELTVHASLTGHLVLSTLHTNSAIGALPRLIDMGIEPFLLAPTLKAVIAQRLVRRICNNCKEEVSLAVPLKTKILEEIKMIPDIYIEDIFNKSIDEISAEDIKIFHGKGCDKCGGLGYKGRSVIAEVLIIDKELKTVVYEGFDEKKVNELAKKQKMITLRQDGILKVLSGVTTLEEIMRIAKN